VPAAARAFPVLVRLALALPAMAQTSPATGFSGFVRSAEEGPMGGVLVSAQSVGGTVTITIVTDPAGYFAFPAGRLP
jgi:hypothetical protein